jgi:hypothetical protein
MKKNVINTLLITLLLASSGILVAGSNNGYTTAANVYSGSSSQGWYGGGVQYWLEKWQQEKIASAAAEAVPDEIMPTSIEKELVSAEPMDSDSSQ